MKKRVRSVISPLPVQVGIHVMGNEEARSLGDQPVQGIQGDLHVVATFEPLAHVMQQCRQ
jgi:hypothetical protein